MGLFDAIFGSPPSEGFDPSVYLSQMQNVDNQINALYAGAPQSNVVGSPAFSQIQSLLAPGPNGSLSTPLQAMYNAGAGQNNLNSTQNISSLISSLQGRGLAGSSTANQALENAAYSGTMANSSLLGQLYGLQNTNNSTLSQLLSQGSEFDTSQNNALLNAHASALGGIGAQYANLGATGMNANLQSQLAGYSNQGNFLSSLISAGLLYGLSPGAGAAAAASPAADTSFLGGLYDTSSPTLDIAGAGYGPVGAGSPGFFTGGAGYGGAGYATPGMFAMNP